MTQVFTGPMTRVYHAAALTAALRLLKRGISPKRGWTRTRVLAAAGRLTGRTYGRGDVDAAITDLTTFAEGVARAENHQK